MTTNNPNIILIGFMASGKSRIGALLAKKLNYTLIDLDNLIEQETNLSIQDIFLQKGENFFRNLEHQYLKKLVANNNLIIITGGGTATFFENFYTLKNLGEIYFLDLNWPIILERLKKNNERPLGIIKNKLDEEKIKNLFDFRRPIYQNLGKPVNINHQDKQKTVDIIHKYYINFINLTKYKQINIKNPKSYYNIFLGAKIIQDIKYILESLDLETCQTAIITSNKLDKILQQEIKQLINILPQAKKLLLKDGEQHKNLNSVEKIHEFLSKNLYTRHSLIIALGGGVIGDISGFAASTYLRGIPIIQIPTSLLSMVDSSVGGKTGVDTEFGKNLVGSFYNPKAVLINPNFLNTLPKEEFSCGMAEIIKHTIIADPELFLILTNKTLIKPIDLIYRAIQVKAKIVSVDPLEKNIRSHLNLGHTFAHALEKVSNYKIKHGQAVAIGLVLATKMAQELNILEEDFLDKLIQLLSYYQLPAQLPQDICKIKLIEAMSYDKKRDNHGIKFILPHKLGLVSQRYVDKFIIENLIKA